MKLPSGFSHGRGKANREVTGTRSDVGNHLTRPKIQFSHDFLRFLVGIPFRVLEHCDVGLRVIVQPLHLSVISTLMVLAE